MSKAERFCVSIEPELLESFDAMWTREGMPTRSEAVKGLIRGALVQREWEADATVAGALVLVYDHHRRELVQKLMDVQHDFAELVVSTQHVHLDHDNCLEVVTLRGNADDIRQLDARIKALKGFKDNALVMTTTGAGIT